MLSLCSRLALRPKPTSLHHFNIRTSSSKKENFSLGGDQHFLNFCANTSNPARASTYLSCQARRNATVLGTHELMKSSLSCKAFGQVSRFMMDPRRRISTREGSWHNISRSVNSPELSKSRRVRLSHPAKKAKEPRKLLVCNTWIC